MDEDVSGLDAKLAAFVDPHAGGKSPALQQLVTALVAVCKLQSEHIEELLLVAGNQADAIRELQGAAKLRE